MKELKIVKKTERELILEIRGEDHTLGNLFAKEALNHPDVTYAAYRIPHPLQDRLEIYISFREGADMSKVLREIHDRIQKYLQDFMREVEVKISEA
ncbi:MAG: RNA polymerase [Thermoprotei archaeon]|nr:MAG: RNA polymerase [Thermoprotei archaeon]